MKNLLSPDRKLQLQSDAGNSNSDMKHLVAALHHYLLISQKRYWEGGIAKYCPKCAKIYQQLKDLGLINVYARTMENVREELKEIHDIQTDIHPASSQVYKQFQKPTRESAN